MRALSNPRRYAVRFMVLVAPGKYGVRRRPRRRSRSATTVQSPDGSSVRRTPLVARCHRTGNREHLRASQPIRSRWLAGESQAEETSGRRIGTSTGGLQLCRVPFSCAGLRANLCRLAPPDDDGQGAVHGEYRTGLRSRPGIFPHGRATSLNAAESSFSLRRADQFV